MIVTFVKMPPQPLGERKLHPHCSYCTLAGKIVTIVGLHNRDTNYETAEDQYGVHRYSRRDYGRVTGSSHDTPDRRNIDMTKGST